jgi:DNA-binding response OmpR family regulator
MARVRQVEDDRDLHQVLHTGSRIKGIRWYPLQRVLAASWLLHEDDIELVVIDVVLPDGSGKTIARETQHPGYTHPPRRADRAG